MCIDSTTAITLPERGRLDNGPGCVRLLLLLLRWVPELQTRRVNCDSARLWGGQLPCSVPSQTQGKKWRPPGAVGQHLHLGPGPSHASSHGVRHNSGAFFLLQLLLVLQLQLLQLLLVQLLQLLLELLQLLLVLLQLLLQPILTPVSCVWCLV
ncbi:unnamed protein product [Lampetra planeri]